MLGDNWFLGQAEFEVWSHASTLVIRLIEDEANNGNCELFFIYFKIKKQKIEFLDDEIPHMITLSSPHHTPSPLQKTRLRLMDEII